jgi:hypothetical protein
MLVSDEDREKYRRMTPSERLHLTFELNRQAWKRISRWPPEMQQRYFTYCRREKDFVIRKTLEALARAEAHNDQ